MTICAFLGHDRVYDKDILSRLQQAVYTVVQKYKEINFAFCGRGEFYDWCYAAALDAKYHFSKKEIHISNEIADRTTLNQASVVITYIYDGFHEKSSMTRRALKAQDIIDLTSAETASRIEKLIEALPEREQLVLRRVNSGETLTQIGTALGVSGSAIRAVRANACRRLRRATHVRLICDKPCAVFALGKATYENVRAFDRQVEYVTRAYGVTSYLIAAEYVGSAFMSSLERYAKHIAAVVHYSVAEDARDIFSLRYCPPCERVVYVDVDSKIEKQRTLSAVDYMLERVGFCVCNLQSTIGSALRKSIAASNGVPVLDIAGSEGRG